jgi:PAS domain S-box-containing protein
MPDPAVKKKVLKELIRRLHSGADPEVVKEQFKAGLGDVGPADIAQAEEELIREGMPKEEVHRLCDVHIAAMREALQKGSVIAPAGHPIHTLMEEHKLMIGFSEELKIIAGRIAAMPKFEAASADLSKVDQIVQRFKDSANHYLREENVLFAYLEKHGITQPPAIMWMEHDQIRGIEKGLYQLVESRDTVDFPAFGVQLREIAASLAETLSGHFYKENNILFPTALRVISEDEWGEIDTQFAEIGFFAFTPESATGKGVATEKGGVEASIEENVKFETGAFRLEVLQAMLDTLPVDITFVDKDDVVRYFSQSPERIFVRTKAVIGRTVQQCHPAKSIDRVNQILAEFKAGTRDKAEFWINTEGRLIFIRYFPVRSKAGGYLGCLEVTQDVTDIRKLEGEKRLL